MKTNPISPKVTIAVVAGAVTTLLVWLLGDFASIDVPGEAATAITTVIMAAAAWLKRDPLREDYIADHYEPRHDA